MAENLIASFTRLDSRRSARIRSFLRTLPPLEGRPLRIAFRPDLRVYRGKLVSGFHKGLEVHAGSFIRDRQIVIEDALLSDTPQLRRILVHEIFHFVWVRLGNPARRSYEGLVEAEMRRGALGELGWSSESRKMALAPEDLRLRTRKWREYVCESFCDTAAWLFTGEDDSGEVTLAPGFRRRRRVWFARFPRAPMLI